MPEFMHKDGLSFSLLENRTFIEGLNYFVVVVVFFCHSREGRCLSQCPIMPGVVMQRSLAGVKKG